jgi:hypothetical protein
MKDKVWAISLIRDEEDIIGYTLAHLVAQGIDGILLQDNGSIDSTVERVREFNPYPSIPVILRVEDGGDIPYNQSSNMSALAEEAASLGAGHIIPFDADELWYCNLGPVAEIIRKNNYACHHVYQWFHYCTVRDDPAELNPYKRMKYRAEDASPWRKVCFRSVPGVKIGGGNHTVCYSDGNSIERGPYADIRIRHFPCRSFKQMAAKIIRHGRGMDAEHPGDPGWGKDGPVHNILYRGFQKEGIEYLERAWESEDPRFFATGFVMVKDIDNFGLIENAAPYGWPWESGCQILTDGIISTPAQQKST